jgi:hypothetical protein
MVLLDLQPTHAPVSVTSPTSMRGSITLRRGCYRWKSGDRLAVVETNRIIEAIMAIDTKNGLFIGRVFPHDCGHYQIKSSTRSLIVCTNDVRLYEIVCSN